MDAMTSALPVSVSAALLAVSLLLPTPAAAELVTKVVEYRQGDAPLEGYLAYEAGGPARRPGVLIVPDWMGVGKNATARADQLARLGYVAFVADVYGKGVRPKSGAEAGGLAGKYKGDRPLLRARVRAGLDELRKVALVDAPRVAAIGYCFGGTTVLELARSGADVAGVVSFHGGLDTPTPADAKRVKAKVLVLHGADDPYVPPAQVAAFEEEMRGGGVDWQLVKYSGAVHSFTIPDAGSDSSKGAAYHAAADRRSWEAMKAFFDEVLR
jgi:dienelactone hydrolase